MGFLAAALPFISAGASLAGGLVGADASMRNGDIQAQIARNNATTENRNATVSAETGDVQATNQGLKTAQTVGKMKATLGASGVDTTSGSAANVESEAEGAGLTDAETIRSNAARSVWGYQVGAQQEEEQAGYDVQAGEFGMLSSFIGGISSAGKNWSQLGNLSDGGTTGGAPASPPAAPVYSGGGIGWST